MSQKIRGSGGGGGGGGGYLALFLSLFFYSIQSLSVSLHDPLWAHSNGGIGCDYLQPVVKWVFLIGHFLNRLKLT